MAWLPQGWLRVVAGVVAKPTSFQRLLSTAVKAEAAAAPQSSSETPVAPPIKLLPSLGKSPLPFDLSISVLQAYAVRPETVDIHVQVSMSDKGSKDKDRDAFQGVAVLPHSFRPEKKVAVFAKGADAEAAKAAGATLVGSADLIEQVQAGKLKNVDVFLSSPDMMKDLRPLGKMLRQQMPTLKKGTVGSDLKAMVSTFQRGMQFKCNADGNILAPVAKSNFTKEAIRANILAFMDAVLQHNQVPGAPFVRKIYLCTTQGSAFQLDIPTLLPDLPVHTAPKRRKKDKSKADKGKTDKKADAKKADTKKAKPVKKTA